MQSSIVHSPHKFQECEALLAKLFQNVYPTQDTVIHMHIPRPTQVERSWVRFHSAQIGEMLLAWEVKGAAHYFDLYKLCAQVQHCNAQKANGLEVAIAERGPTLPAFEYPYVVYDAGGVRIATLYVAPVVEACQGSSSQNDCPIISQEFHSTLLKYLPRRDSSARLSCVMQAPTLEEIRSKAIQSITKIADRSCFSFPISLCRLTWGGLQFVGELLVKENRCVFHIIERFKENIHMNKNERAEDIGEGVVPHEQETLLKEEALPIELCLGELELTAKDILSLRPGMQIEFETEELAVVLKFGPTEWAKGKLLVTADKFTVRIDKLLNFSTLDATFPEN